MVLNDYRIDPQTGAVIFRKNARKQKMRELEREVTELKQKVDELENQIQLILKQKVGDNND